MWFHIFIMPMVTILDGKSAANMIKSNIAQETKKMQDNGASAPHLAIVLVGEDPASHVYVKRKLIACQEVGINVSLDKLHASTTADDLHNIIQKMNNNPAIDGIIVQLPLPPHIPTNLIVQGIIPHKDVDGLHAWNYGKMALGLPAPIPATPLGILLLLSYYQINTVGKHCVIVGRGPTVGAPLSILMHRNDYPGNATVTLCHSQTKDLACLTRQADILITAVGHPNLITREFVAVGATVIDVGITRVTDTTKKMGYRLQGDVAFDEVAPLCQFITPVPGGIGPMTIAALLINTLLAAKKMLSCTLFNDIKNNVLS
jgi:methylenetetrahydrofolate dehydrogenase (NADP+)/methenyltetrahydrofolate cyclohydrolase